MTTSLFIVGAGRVGRSLSRALQGHGQWQVLGASNRSPIRAAETAGLLGVPTFGELVPMAASEAAVVVVSVVDDAVASVAPEVAAVANPEAVVLHTSGAHGRELLADHGLADWACGSCHPLQSLADETGAPELLTGAYFAVEGDPVALEISRRLALACGGRPVVVPDGGKTLYHAAAVVSANFSTVLVDTARQLGVAAGIDSDEIVAMLLPLLQGTLDNTKKMTAEHGAERGLALALTGPARRGDHSTLRRHQRELARLDTTGDLSRLYALLAARARELAERSR